MCQKWQKSRKAIKTFTATLVLQNKISQKWQKSRKAIKTNLNVSLNHVLNTFGQKWQKSRKAIKTNRERNSTNNFMFKSEMAEKPKGD